MNSISMDPCTSCSSNEACVFGRLSNDCRQHLHAMSQAKVYARGISVLRQGEEANGFFIVRAGVVKILRVTPDGRTARGQLLGPPGIVGLTEVMTGETHQASVETVEVSQLEFIPRRDFDALLSDFPQVASELLVWISKESQRLQTELSELTSKPPMASRLMHKLHELSLACGCSTEGGVILSPHLTVQDLADSLGCSRQWASRLLGEVESQGLIERRGRRIVLTQSALDAGNGHGTD